MGAIGSSPFQSNLSLMNGVFPAIQPAAKGKRSEKWDPKPSEEKLGFQEAHNCISIRDPIRAKLIVDNNKNWHTDNYLKVKKTHSVMQSTPLQLTQHYADLIQHHVASRTARFFQQAVMCYNTPFHFEIADTEGQFFTAPTLKVATKKNVMKTVKYQAAHSSTIPGLKACLRSDMAKAKPHYFSFLPGSHMENLDNSTVGLPIWVNQMDTLIDGRSKQPNVLRSDTIALINQVALAQITPNEATRQFLNCFENRLISRPRASTTMNAEKGEVIRQYLLQVQHMKVLAAKPENSQEPHPFFDSLLSVNVSNEKAEDVPKIRKIVYARKYEIIREAQLLESKIHEIILEGIKQFNHEQKHFIKLALLYRVKNDTPLKKALEKLFCISVAGIEQNPALVASLEQYYQDNKVILDNKLRDIRIQLRNFRKMEQSFQAMLLRDFRKNLRNLTQKELSDKTIAVIAQKKMAELAKAVPDLNKVRELQLTATSPSTISRLENSRIHIVKAFKTDENQRRKPLNLHHAVLLSEALKIQPGHFFCSFFNSDD